LGSCYIYVFGMGISKAISLMSLILFQEFRTYLYLLFSALR